MSDVELIIKIPEEIYKASQIIDVKYEDVVQIPLEVIANGTPIPDATNDEIIEKIRNIDADNLSGNFVKALCIDFLMSERSDKE